MKELLKIYSSFFRIGILTFGGGYTMLPMLVRETVQKRRWLSEEELLDYYALSQVIPGIIAINTSNFIGHKVKGRIGGLAGVLGMLTPSVVVISLVYYLLLPYMDLPWIRHGFNGIRFGVTALVLDAVLKMAKKGIVDSFSAVLFIAVGLLIFFTTLNPVYLVILGAMSGLFMKRIGAR